MDFSDQLRAQMKGNRSSTVFSKMSLSRIIVQQNNIEAERSYDPSLMSQKNWNGIKTMSEQYYINKYIDT